jgi:hypothetical protein
VERRVRSFSEFLGGKELSNSLTLLDVSPIRQDLEGGAEFLELLLPVVECAVGGDDKEGTPDPLCL